MEALAPPWKPYGMALLEYYRGNPDARFLVHTRDGVITPMPASLFFRDGDDISIGDDYALSLCDGHVLDIGAGSGSMALALLEMGLEVTALDVSEEAVQVMRERGVPDAHAGDIYSFTQGQYDTLLMTMNGIGFVGNLEGLDRFLDHAATLLAPGGQMLLDSSDLDQQEFGPELRAPEGQYKGEIWYQMEYGPIKGAPYTWLYVDARTLGRHARARGWKFHIVFRGPEGYFLARLTRK